MEGHNGTDGKELSENFQQQIQKISALSNKIQDNQFLGKQFLKNDILMVYFSLPSYLASQL